METLTLPERALQYLRPKQVNARCSATKQKYLHPPSTCSTLPAAPRRARRWLGLVWGFISSLLGQPPKPPFPIITTYWFVFQGPHPSPKLSSSVGRSPCLGKSRGGGGNPEEKAPALERTPPGKPSRQLSPVRDGHWLFLSGSIPTGPLCSGVNNTEIHRGLYQSEIKICS